jgi:uncharacterized protein YciU (UPF0263 family)
MLIMGEITKTHWVMDYETMSNTFIACFESIKSDERHVFVMHDLQNDWDEYIEFLKRNILYNEWHVSYNGLGFDGQITEYIIQNAGSLSFMGGSEIAEWVYTKAQYVINKQGSGEFLDYYEKNMSIRQVDVFKLNHWDNPAKRSSLKWIQYSMDWPSIQDMPLHHTTKVTTFEQIDMIVGYCWNDVESTKRIMMLSKNQIALRKTLTEEYNISLFSASEPRISKELFLHFLSERTGIKKYDLRQLRTKRESIIVKDIILDYVKFDTATFQKLLTRFNEIIVYPEHTKGGFKYSINYKGVKTDFGLGGIHGARTSGIYKSDEDMVIMTSDVVSYYPNLAIRNGWSPAHLPKVEFCELYEWFFDERKKISKKDVRNYVYKIILNSTYGLSNDANSFLYDPEFTMRITINGQLSLCMLYEMIIEEIPNAVPLMQNTDGLETVIPREYQEKYLEICERWEKITNLQLEHDTYSKMIIGDVNNYIAIHDYKLVDEDRYNEMKQENPHYLFKEGNGTFYYAATKCKGRFEFNNLALHKNKSFLIIPKAIYYYFVHGIKPEEYLLTQTNIFDYCGGVKIKGNWGFVEEKINDGIHSVTELQNTIRYYISERGSKIVKQNKDDGRQIQVESGKWMQTPFINFVEKPFNDYLINNKYYLQKIYKEVHQLEPNINQLKLF